MNLDTLEGASVRRNEPLSRHLPWRTGGACDVFVVVHRRESLGPALAACRGESLNVTLLGAGTRSAVRDGGLAGAVLRLGTDWASIAPGETWAVGAAVPVPALVAAAIEAGKSGVEDFAASAGSFGASLLLDEGWDGVVAEARWFWRGATRTGTLDELRKAGKKAIVEGATLRLAAADPATVRKRSLARLKGDVRGVWTPPCSWYEAPKRVGLRDLLERVGLGDVRLRDVLLPAVAPELLVNLGGAPARDLALLHQSAIERVGRETGVVLEKRIGWLGRRD